MNDNQRKITCEDDDDDDNIYTLFTTEQQGDSDRNYNNFVSFSVVLQKH